MAPRGGDEGAAIDFYISHSPADEQWAAWIGWQLEAAGYRTFLAAWDHAYGSDEHGERVAARAAAVLAVVSLAYLSAEQMSAERRVLLRADPAALLAVRVDGARNGLPQHVTPLDLHRVPDARTAAAALLDRARAVRPAPPHPGAGGRLALRRAPLAAPGYPPAVRSSARTRSGLAILHVAGPRFGRGVADSDEPVTAAELRTRIHAGVMRWTDAGAPRPDLLVVSGDLTDGARPRQLEQAWEFLTGLRVSLGLDAGRMIVVPGGRDVSRAACQAYFHLCDARDITPLEPYYPKLEMWAELFADLYRGLDGPQFDAAQAWTLFTVPELRVAVAGLNSTIAITHRPRDNYGRIGEEQASWFAQRLRRFEESGWLRVGVLRHDPLPGIAGTADPSALRDADTLEDLLGSRLDLLLHGPGPGGTGTELLGGRLPVLPAAGPGRAELIDLTADGIARWTWPARNPAGEAGGVPVRAPWRQPVAPAAFAAIGPEPEPEPVPALPPADDPHRRLLHRIADVCAARHPGARIRPVDTRPPQLLVTHQEGGYTVQQRVGAWAAELTTEVIDDFCRHDDTDGSELVHAGPAPSPAVRQHAQRRRVRLRTFASFQGLLDLSRYTDALAERLRVDPGYPPEHYVPQRFRELGRGTADVRDDLAAELYQLVTGEDGQFVLVLGDFGRGKSFALREVARRLATDGGPIAPVLIDLAAMDGSLPVDGLVAAHLAQHGEDRIDLAAFRYMLAEGRIVLFFDGFDELVTRISYERAADHLEALLAVANGRAKVVVASRTQHFRSHAQVLTALGERVGLVEHRRVFEVEAFTRRQIRAYLVNRHGGDVARAERRYALLAGIGDLLGLAQNPRMLGFIAGLDEERIRAAARNRDTISAAGLYREVLHAWMEHERRRAPDGPDPDAMWAAVTALAVRLWEAEETYLPLERIAEVADALGGLAGADLAPDQRLHAVASGSLLVRTEEGLFGFIHPSVTEWLVARAIAAEFTAGADAPTMLAHRELTQPAVEFLCDLAPTGPLQVWVSAALRATDDTLRTNALKVRTRLETPASADLRGADMRGEDLSHRQLVDRDLSGADLTGADLGSADLSGADLTGARLVGARLDRARLVGADLSGADLRRARLGRADLTGATTTPQTRWERAALVDTVGVPGYPRGAAVTPRHPVEAEIAPSAVGVAQGSAPLPGVLPEVLAYSPDGDLLALASDDGGVLVCDTATGTVVRTLHGHRSRVCVVTYGGNRLVTAAEDGTVRLWDAADGQAGHVLAGHAVRPWPVVVDDDGATVVAADGAGVLRIWDAATGRLRHELRPAAPVVSLALHGSTLAAALGDGTVALWDTPTEVAGTVVGPVPDVRRVVFGQDGTSLVVGAAGGGLSVWGLDGAQRHDLRGHTGEVLALATRDDVLLAGDTDGGARLWNLADGTLRAQLPGHAAAIGGVALGPSGQVAATGDASGELRVWDTATGALQHELVGHTGSVWPFTFRPDGAELAVADDQRTTRLWDPATGTCRHVLSGHGRQVHAVRFSASGDLLATCGNEGTIRLWNPRTGQLVRELTGHADRVFRPRDAVFNPTQQQLALIGDDVQIEVLDATTGRPERQLRTEFAPVWAVAFDATGDRLATGEDDDTLRVRHVATGRLLYTLREHTGRVRSIAFSPDAPLLATGCDDSHVRLFDARTGTLLRTLTGHTDRVYAVAFGSGWVASASWDGTAAVWDLATGVRRHVLTRHEGRLWAAAADRSGRLLATAGDDLVIRLWDAASGDHLQRMRGHARPVRSLAFHPRKDVLASGSNDGTARLWSVTVDHATRSATLLGLPRGAWAALGLDGRYKADGDVEGHFWHVVGLHRFEPGELGALLPSVRPMPPHTPL
ncbi:pentapeptide repeat-containing protein [Pseudonocardia sp. CA-107938]|uniref:WD40 domain-containing protein n=1 Tax=Pseudonocardia sp. CA-107938 TaxID=3240021 RepID=UPI003D8EC32C